MNHTHHLPAVYGGPTIPAQGEPGLDKAQEFFRMMRDHPEQGRVGMVWNEMLARAAFSKCYQQSGLRYTGHVDPYGHGPNWLVRALGYKLPDWYSDDDDANNIESLSHHGDGTAAQTFASLLNSPGHRVHILATDKFYAAQTHVGIGYYEGGEKGHYWCILSAPPEEE